MIRREARLRREYLYRKSLEGKRATEYEKRLAIRNALAEGKPIPTNLRRTEAAFRHTDGFKDILHDAPTSHIDDEYANAAHAPPRVVITTSRAPSSRLSQFAKELKLIFPNAQRLNRGNLVMDQLVASCRANEMTDVIICHETRGEPDGLIVSHLPFGPTAFFNISNCVMRHDIDEGVPPVSEAYPHLIFDNFLTTVGIRVSNILKHLFPAPKSDSKRIITFANVEDAISFRHHTYVKNGRSKDDITLTEAGPRFELRLYQIRLGTIEQKEADDEWVLRPHMNTAKRRRILA